MIELAVSAIFSVPLHPQVMLLNVPPNVVHTPVRLVAILEGTRASDCRIMFLYSPVNVVYPAMSLQLFGFSGAMPAATASRAPPVILEVLSHNDLASKVIVSRKVNAPVLGRI